MTRLERWLAGQPKAEVGMILFLLSEAVFFALLAIAYVVYRNASPWPAAARPLDAAVTAVYTLALILSSVSWWLAERDARLGRLGPQRLWMGVTILLGAIFLVGQGREYARLIRQGVTIGKAGLFGTSFYTLTGFHGLHVLVGLTLLTVLLALAGARGRRWAPPAALATAGYYWHFVDGVWLVIYSLVYLWR